MAFTTSVATRWLELAARFVDGNAERLTELDSAIGDGDHGTNLARGLAAAVTAVQTNAPATPGAVLRATGSALISGTGGAFGPLLGTGMRRAGKALGEDEPAAVHTVAKALTAMLSGMQELGGAVLGDKTAVDALAPAVTAFDNASASGADLAAAASAAADAADDGRDQTVAMQARKGRASYLGERSIGTADPGATSMALIVAALAEAALR
ncbi:MAG TPA: dihydroxyacetone kinase subunit DhaL [Jiangellaceae bacterium]|nr:dihydroxyacetone kinase subunit DhaL [Jiangellaceae bacterium]